MKKSGVTLVMGGTSDYAFALGNVLIGLETFSSGLVDDVALFHNGISEHDQRCLRKIRQCRFVEYDPPALRRMADTVAVRRFSLLSFVPYEIFRLLDHAEYVLFLDADVVILRDIRGLLEYAAPIGMKEGGYPLNVSLGPNSYGFRNNILGHSSGVIIAHESLPYAGLAEQCYDLTAKHRHSLRYPDQGIINLVLHLNRIQVKTFPKTYNSGMADFVPGRHILHETLQFKFWSHGMLNLMSPEWEAYDRQWRALGGTPYKGEKRLWKFKELQADKTRNLLFMAAVFNDVLQRFLAALQARIKAAGVSATSPDEYSLQVHHAAFPDFRYVASIWGIMAKIEFFTRDKELFNDCKTIISRLPPEEAKTFALEASAWGSRIRKEQHIDAAFLNNGSGLAFCTKALNDLARITVQARPGLADFLHPLTSVYHQDVKHSAANEKAPDPGFVFDYIYANNLWGKGSGSGSSYELNKGYIDFLHQFFKIYKINSVCDIGCGDWQFSKHIDYTNIIYEGYDVSEQIIKNNKNFKKENINFIHYDGNFEKVKQADLVIVKEVLQHLPNSWIEQYIKSLYKFKYAIIGNIYRKGMQENIDIPMGRYRCLDLRQKPFNLPCREVFRIVRRPSNNDIAFFLWENPDMRA